MIRKAKGGWVVVSHQGKSLGGPYPTRAEAERRLSQVEMFKHMKGEKGEQRHGSRHG